MIQRIIGVGASLFFPRLVAAYLYLLTNWFTGVFETRLWPVLGFLFMPYTMLWYSAVVNWYGSQWGFFQILILIVAVFADLGSGKHAKDSY